MRKFRAIASSTKAEVEKSSSSLNLDSNKPRCDRAHELLPCVSKAYRQAYRISTEYRGQLPSAAAAPLNALPVDAPAVLFDAPA